MSIRLVFFFASLLLLAIVHKIALELFLYWRFLWFDLPMHVLGGFCAALGYSILPFIHMRREGTGETLMWYLLVVFAIGVAWEIFEYAAGISLAREVNLALDTGLDLIMGLLGGLLGYGLVKSMRIFSE
jgi:hypothetical protein